MANRGGEVMAFAIYPKSKDEVYCNNCKHKNPPEDDGSCSAYGYNGVDCQPQPCICRAHILSEHPQTEEVIDG